ncbi:MAG: bile acid:sodium symporter family protein [Bacteroidetes bacterium]|nr:bile acid:sodium symporter family protein [Bacteroidota bacterium]
MVPLDEVSLQFNPTTLNILNIILGLIVFGVSLNIKVVDFKVLAKSPKPFLVGVMSQFLLFPALAFLVILLIQPPPSVALGIILVAACPGGNISNFMTLHAKGNAALSIAMSAFSTALATIMTPFNIAFWGSKIASTDSLMNDVSLDPLEMFFMILILMLIPLTSGIYISNRFPRFAYKLQKFMRVFSLTFFGGFIIFGIAINLKYFYHLKGVVSLSVIGLNALGFLIGYGFSYLMGLKEYDRRAVSIETGIQNSGLGLILVFNFFEGLGGMALIAAFWGVWHIIAGLLLSTYWSHRKITIQTV